MIATRLVLLIGGAVPVFAQYAGPAILTRGEVPSSAQQAQVDFRPYLDINGIYDSGMISPSTDAQGNLTTNDIFGVEAGVGLYGLHRWKRTTLGLDYRGNFRHYSRKTYYDGSDHTLTLGFTRRTTRHTTLSLRESAGTYTRSFGLLGFGGLGTFDPTLGYLPANDFFDNRTTFLASQADFTYQRSARLSFNAGGDTFVVRYRSKALTGLTGAAARGDMQYRMSRHSTVGLSYNYSAFRFTRATGTTDMHSVAGTYSVRLSRNWEFSSYAGATRYETKFLRLVTLDPAIAALLGRTSLPALSHRIDYAPLLGGRLVRGFRHGSFNVNGMYGITPGNAVFLTSKSTTLGVGYSYTGIRRWNFGIDVSGSDASSESGFTGKYRTVTAGFGATRQIGRFTHMVLRFDGRKYDSGSFSNYNRVLYRASIGLGFAPGDLPLSIW